MAKGLFDRCLSHEKTLEHVRVRAEATEEELAELKAWKLRHEEKLKLSEKVRGELEKEVDAMKKALAKKNESPCHAKTDAIQEHWDSEVLLSELSTSFVDSFEDCLRQVKASFPDLNLSHINVDPEGQTTGTPVDSVWTDELFGEEQSDGEAQKLGEKGFVEDDAYQPLIKGPSDKEDTVVVQE